jgi:Asp-tRNA(Asn)/Glu-tRNA(Gln) amidotransferase A subunit family amidase
LVQATDEGLIAFEERISLLEHAGYTVKRLPMFEDIDEINAHHRLMIAAEVAHEHREWFQNYQTLYRPRTAEIILQGRQVSSAKLQLAQQARFVLRTYLTEQQATHGIDLWISPPAIKDAPRGIHATGDPIMNLPWTHAGYPCLNIPAGLSKHHLPLGLQVSAGFMQDEKLIFWAQRIAEVLKY